MIRFFRAVVGFVKFKLAEAETDRLCQSINENGISPTIATRVLEIFSNASALYVGPIGSHLKMVREMRFVASLAASPDGAPFFLSNLCHKNVMVVAYSICGASRTGISLDQISEIVGTRHATFRLMEWRVVSIISPRDLIEMLKQNPGLLRNTFF